MKLNIQDRLSIISLCPERADILTQLVVKDLIKKVELSQKDIEKANVRSREDGPGLQWDTGELPLKNVTFSDAELELLKSQVEKRDSEKKITQNVLETCLKIRDEKAQKKVKK